MVYNNYQLTKAVKPSYTMNIQTKPLLNILGYNRRFNLNIDKISKQYQMKPLYCKI